MEKEEELTYDDVLYVHTLTIKTIIDVLANKGIITREEVLKRYEELDKYDDLKKE